MKDIDQDDEQHKNSYPNSHLHFQYGNEDGNIILHPQDHPVYHNHCQLSKSLYIFRINHHDHIQSTIVVIINIDVEIVITISVSRILTHLHVPSLPPSVCPQASHPTLSPLYDLYDLFDHTKPYDHSCKKALKLAPTISPPKKLAPKMRDLQHFQIRDKTAKMPFKLSIF